MEKQIQNFICIGAQKAGTTTLAEILSQHSDIYIPQKKETKFFLFDEDYNKGISFYNQQYFNDYKNEKAAGEFDPDYLLFPFTAKRIKETLGNDVKLIVVLRNPATRAYSHYLMTKRKGLEPLDFVEATEAEAKRKNNIKEEKIFAYLQRGYYGKQLEEYLQVFNKRNFLFLTFEEDIVKNMNATVKRIQQFLQVEIQELNTSIHSNEASEAKNKLVRDIVRRPNKIKQAIKAIIPTKSIRRQVRKYFITQNMKASASQKLNEETQKYLIEKYFRNDILKTQQLTGLDLSAWLSI